MKFKYLFALVLSALLYSCDDSTYGIGDSTISSEDPIPAGEAKYYATTNSILADSIYARTNTAYLGKYTDPTFGEFTADFIAQFNCTDNFEFPENIQKINKLELSMYYTTFYGDSLNNMVLQVDTLDTIIPEKELSTFYTSVDPKLYYNSSTQPIARKAYAALGPSTVDTVYTHTDMYGTTTEERIMWHNVSLPISLGEHMYNKYKEDKNNYKDAESFIKNVLKGIYVHCTNGDGTILYIDDMELILDYDYYIKGKSGKLDSLVAGTSVFAATKEVIQANRFQNSEGLKELIEKTTDCTYLKTPAGIYTQATLPIEEISEIHKNDTLNAASITFTRYNEKEGNNYPMATPKYLLMVRKCDMYSFFENNKLHDNKTSFLTEYKSSGEDANTYKFLNVAPLISYCMNEKNNGKADKDWDKVVLIPVNIETDTNGSVISIRNDLDLGSTRLMGGEKDKITMQVLYTTF